MALHPERGHAASCRLLEAFGCNKPVNRAHLCVRVPVFMEELDSFNVARNPTRAVAERRGGMRHWLQHIVVGLNYSVPKTEKFRQGPMLESEA